MRTKILSLLSILSLSFFIAGCTIPGTSINIPIPFLDKSTPTPVSNEPVTLNYWSLFESYEVYQPLIEEYQKDHPNVKINYEEKVFDNLDAYKDTLLSKMKLKDADSPDILRINSTWVSSFSPYLSPSTTDVFTPSDIQSNFYSTVSSTSVVNNKVYAVPLMFDSLALFYNKDIFEQANASPPKSWSDFADLAALLTKGSGSTITQSGAAFGSAGNVAHFSDVLGLLMNQSDIELPRDINSSAMKEIISFYTSFVTNAKVWDPNLPYSPVSFAQGKTAMMFGPSWELLDILENNPNLNVGVAPVPQVVSEDSLTDDNFSTYWVESVNANSKHSKEAWEFLKWLSAEDQLRSAFNNASNQRLFGQPYPRVSMQNELVSNPFLSPFYVNADKARTLKIADMSGNSNYVNIFKTVVEGVINGGDLDQLLQTASQEYSRLDSMQ
ncbi:hypothetical protein COV24_02455 [candidate division WWE3 bacterium CG10_big_fil_rev_8_21_14_0_10_32_10]|uniref:ABC transporter substrate-binding protein n=1 Tax=candidate division WWE3 bacterium CG10_big_fil_rev_8_21_14_0_10_32_10 TaxID=1975090 RepID=A0A2H0RBS9_UNCKA|nr:MAG: hypothetical protein COV24_02455 [candidate division WWE3 bacterium CG10_big_fil_rev_8_21_14_0_10_32_10]